jgi:hypothetical protein
LHHAEERVDALEAKLKVTEEAKLKADDLEAKHKTSETTRNKAEKMLPVLKTCAEDCKLLKMP